MQKKKHDEQNKVCNKCGEEKPLSEFHKLKNGKHGRNPACRVCRNAHQRANKRDRSEYMKIRYQENREALLQYHKDRRVNDPEHAAKLNAYHREYYQENKEAEYERQRKWALENPEKTRARVAKWSKNNRGKKNFYNKKRETAKYHRTPLWFEEDLIRKVYEKCQELNDMWGTNFVVDHYYPLQGETVSGLHCWENLQLMDLTLNAKKSNKNPDDIDYKKEFDNFTPYPIYSLLWDVSSVGRAGSF